MISIAGVSEGLTEFFNMLFIAFQTYPMEDILYGPYKMKDFSPELINALVEKLIPSRLL